MNCSTANRRNPPSYSRALSRVLWFLYALTCVGCGCSALNRSAPPSGAFRFSEQEIRSKMWADPQGQPVKLLEWAGVRFQGEELVIVKYGTTNPRYVTCLDFYRVICRPQGRAVSALEPSLTAPPPSMPIYTNVPGSLSFELLLHDYLPEMVAAVSTEDRGDTMLITVLRETIPGHEKQREGLRYLLTYSKSRGVQWNPALEQWAITEMKK